MMRADGIGLYLHVPLCVRKCNYCDFCSYPEKDAHWREEYTARLIAEIDSYKGQEIAVDTVFIGGGTPSLLMKGELELIVSHLRDTFVISDEAEFTLEANPGTLDSDKLRVFKSCGVNRLSLGLQSIHENELKKLGRIHSNRDFLDAFNLARSYGFNNINVDIMYGIPEQTPSSFVQTVKEVCALSPEHLSVYGLILEEGTPFFENVGLLSLPTEDEECDMYYSAASLLGDFGYSHYEISNYTKPGYECRHNLKYWRNLEYIGVGVSAHSYFRGRRYSNSPVISEYLSAVHAPCMTSVDGDGSFEYVMLRLRLSEGIPLNEYQTLYGRDFLVHRRDKIDMLCNSGYAKLSNGRFSLTERGFYVSNAIITELL